MEHEWIMTFHSVGNFIIPTDELIFFRGVAQPPTRFVQEANQAEIPKCKDSKRNHRFFVVKTPEDGDVCTEVERSGFEHIKILT